MKALKILVVFGLGLLLMAACQSEEEGDSITGVEWQWQSVTNQSSNVTTMVGSPSSYTITFNDDGTLEGLADCNNFSGTYSQDSGFTIDIGATTLAFCGETSLDAQYLELLNNVAAGGPDGSGGLALETAGGEMRMLFEE